MAVELYFLVLSRMRTSRIAWYMSYKTAKWVWGLIWDRLCCLVVRAPGCRSRGPGSIPSATKFWEVVGLERGPLSLVNANEELLEKKISGSGLEIREYCRGDPSRWQCGTLYPWKLALTSPTRGSRSIGIVRSRTQTTEFFFVWVNLTLIGRPAVNENFLSNFCLFLERIKGRYAIS
jgi:hypothetical protein